jgi:hypothetical protein
MTFRLYSGIVLFYPSTAGNAMVLKDENGRVRGAGPFSQWNPATDLQLGSAEETLWVFSGIRR